MVEAFAIMAGTALEYGDRMLACLDETEQRNQMDKPFSIIA